MCLTKRKREFGVFEYFRHNRDGKTGFSAVECVHKISFLQNYLLKQYQKELFIVNRLWA